MKALSQIQASHLDVNKPLTRTLLLGVGLYTLCILFIPPPFPLYSCAISCNLVTVCPTTPVGCLESCFLLLCCCVSTSGFCTECRFTNLFCFTRTALKVVTNALRARQRVDWMLGRRCFSTPNCMISSLSCIRPVQNESPAMSFTLQKNWIRGITAADVSPPVIKDTAATERALLM